MREISTPDYIGVIYWIVNKYILHREFFWSAMQSNPTEIHRFIAQETNVHATKKKLFQTGF
jgi:hypothetical protein